MYATLRGTIARIAVFTRILATFVDTGLRNRTFAVSTTSTNRVTANSRIADETWWALTYFTMVDAVTDCSFSACGAIYIANRYALPVETGFVICAFIVGSAGDLFTAYLGISDETFATNTYGFMVFDATV